MSLFVDASAIIAMLAEESDALILADRLDGNVELLWSPMVQWEAIAGLARARGRALENARDDVDDFGRQWAFKLVTIGAREGELAFEALRLYGKSSGHPAQLNMGDCFAYACAKAHQARLLYKGDDLARTDLA